jgi:hypothetical protein
VREAFGEKFDVPRGYLDTAAIGVPLARVADTLVDAVHTWRAGQARRRLPVSRGDGDQCLNLSGL